MPPTYYILIHLHPDTFLCISIHPLACSSSGLRPLALPFSCLLVLHQFAFSSSSLPVLSLCLLFLNPSAFLRFPSSFLILRPLSFGLPLASLASSFSLFPSVLASSLLRPSGHRENTTLQGWRLLFCSGLKTAGKLRPHASRLFCSIRRSLFAVSYRAAVNALIIIHIIPRRRWDVNTKSQIHFVKFFTLSRGLFKALPEAFSRI